MGANAGSPGPDSPVVLACAKGLPQGILKSCF